MIRIIWRPDGPRIVNDWGGTQLITPGHELWDEVAKDPRINRIDPRFINEQSVDSIGNTRPRSESEVSANDRPSQRPRTDTLDSVPDISLDNLTNDIDMSDPSGSGSGSGSRPNAGDPAPEAMQFSSTGQNQVSKETPISNYPTLTYGLQETHTTILPWTGWFSYIWPDKQSPIQVKARTNALYDIFPNVIKDNSVTLVKGLYNKPLKSDGSIGGVFPAEMKNNANTTTERPQWRDYWAAIYEYYTILGLEWKLTITNEATVRNADIAIAVQYDSYSNAEGLSGNIMPLTKLSETLAFKGIQWYGVDSASGTDNQLVSNTKIIKGHCKPGQIKHNIINDGDIKTWVKTDGSIPALNEFLTFNIFQSALNCNTPSASSGQGNCQLELKYIVQFKDLRQDARYPNSAVGLGTLQVINTAGTTTAGTDQVRYTQE